MLHIDHHKNKNDFPSTRPHGWVPAALLVCLLCVGLGGCALAPDAAGNVAEQTGTALHMGKCDTFVEVGKDEVIAQVRKVAVKLSLALMRQEKHPDQLKMIYDDMRGQDIVVTVVWRSAQMTEIRVDVGILGPESLGNLMLRKILEAWPGTLRSSMP